MSRSAETDSVAITATPFSKGARRRSLATPMPSAPRRRSLAPAVPRRAKRGARGNTGGGARARALPRDDVGVGLVVEPDEQHVADADRGRAQRARRADDERGECVVGELLAREVDGD